MNNTAIEKPNRPRRGRVYVATQGEQEKEGAIDVGKKLADLRESKGLRQEDVAYKSGMGKDVYARLERGESDPRVSTIRRLLKVFSPIELARIFFNGDSDQ